MFHLNEHGWGLSTLITFVFIFLLAILLISVNAYKMGLTSNNVSNMPITSPDSNNNDNSTNEKENVNDSSKYIILENDLKNAGVIYKENYYNSLIAGDSVYVTSRQLIESNILTVQSFIDGECSGYVKIKNDAGSFIYIPYLKCGASYKTPGFIEDLAQ